MTDSRLRTALITGASAGLGAEFARQLAQAGHDLVLVARDEARLAAGAKELSERFGISVEVLPADLATVEGCDQVAERLTAETSAPVDILVNNAGFGLYQAFGKATLADEERMLDVNVRAVLRLTYAAVNAMRPRGRGQIINIASVAGFVPRPETTTYGAGKAYVIALTEGLSLLLEGTGVTATAVCPGFTRTEFHERAGVRMSHVPSFMWLSAADVVRAGLADAERGRAVSVPDWRYKTIVAATRLLPRGAASRLGRRAERRR